MAHGRLNLSYLNSTLLNLSSLNLIAQRDQSCPEHNEKNRKEKQELQNFLAETEDILKITMKEPETSVARAHTSFATIADIIIFSPKIFSVGMRINTLLTIFGFRIVVSDCRKKSAINMCPTKQVFRTLKSLNLLNLKS